MKACFAVCCKVKVAVALFWSLTGFALAEDSLPDGFVYLRDIAPSIVQDIRYATFHNFVGRPIDGYNANECILTGQAATLLAGIQERLVAGGFSLIVWDCYRPARAVADFKSWGGDPTDQAAKAEFYPNEDKAQFFKRGYLASRSRHSSGSTVDLGIMPLDSAGLAIAPMTDPPIACFAPYGERYDDHALDFGTGYDCLDPVSSFDDPTVTADAKHNRATLRQLMTAAGFIPYDKEWWHFELADEPFPKKYFDFPITERPR